MTANRIDRLLAIGIYVVTAVYCWLIPSRFTGADGTVVINSYSTRAFALASVALAVVHAALSLRGRLAVAVAASCAVATMFTVTMFALLPSVSWATWSMFQLAQGALVAAAAAGLGALAWQVGRQPPPTKHLLARALVALGILLLATCYATIALRLVGVLRPAEGLEQMAEVTADLTVSLWIASAVLLFGAVIYAVFPWRVQLNAA